MRVLTVGAGAIGGYFGGRMQEAGADMTFLVRPRRRAQLAATGLVIKSPAGDVTLPARTALAEEIAGPYDLVILSCKAYDLDGAMDSMAPAVGPQTMILPLLNGMNHMDALERRFGPQGLLGGLCSIAATLDDQGAILHMSPMQSLVFGERAGGQSPRVKGVAALMDGMKAPWRLSDDVVQEMWEKWVFLAALAACTCLLRAGVGDIVAAGGADTVAAVLAETQSVAAAAGHAARPDVLAKAHGLLTAPGSTLTASMMRDVERHGPTEADHVIGDLLRRGVAAGLGLPILELAYLHLKAYEERRRREWS